jgi:hypothetical protein
MLDPDFCIFLEYEITKAFAHSTNNQLKYFWCDGVLLPNSESEYSKKFVNDNRQIVMMAYSGLSGQEHYELTLLFGKKALSRYARDLDITECVPDLTDSNYWDIDVERLKIWIQLL